MARTLEITVSGWTSTTGNVSLLPKKGGWTMTVDRAKVLRYHVTDPKQLTFIREAIFTMERDWSGLNVSSPTDSGSMVVKYDVSNYSLAEVVQLISIAADRVSRAFAAIH